MKMGRKLLLLALLSIAVPSFGANLLTNGDFNTGDFTGWYVVANETSCWVEINDYNLSVSYDGTVFVAVWCEEESPGGVAGQVIDIGEPNSMPTLTFNCVANRSEWNTWGDAIVEMDYYEPNDTWLGYEEYIMFQNDDVIDDWTPFNHTFTVHPKAGKVDFRIRGTNWVQLYFDNVSLEFVEPDQAQYVYPVRGETVPWEDQDNCGNGVTLSWITAPFATGEHHVYLGTSEEDVLNATDSDPEYMGSVPLGTPSYTLALSDVEKGQMHYWRVDETTDGGVVKSDSAAKFMVSNETRVDYFDYADSMELRGVWGSKAELDNGALSIVYDNSGPPYTTELDADTTDFSTCSTNWAFGDNELLILDVKGHDDMIDSVYVTLESNGGAEDGTVQYADVRELNQQPLEIFRTWVIPFADFADQGVDMTNVTKMIMGVGTKDSPTAGGSGAVLVDNIRLSIAVCLADLIAVDINNDCSVDEGDIVDLAADWLESEYTVTSAEPSRGPILWYKFNEGAGADANDSSGLGYHGRINLSDSWAGEGSGYDGSNCLNLGNTAWVEVPIDAANIGDPGADPNLFNLGAESTVSLWVRDPGQTDADSMYFEIGGKMSLWLGATGNLYYGAGGESLIWGPDYLTNPEHPQDEWVHYAFVKNNSANYMRIYQNGMMVAEMFADSIWNPDLDGSSTFFSIGAWRWSGGSGGYVDGLMDDFRLYDYALSHDEVLSLAVEGGTATSPLAQTLITPANVIADSRIDLEDFAEVASKWLEEVVYP
jgi:hypothetical protein